MTNSGSALRRLRWTRLLLSSGLVAASMAFAAPADAAPDSWWYDYLDLPKVQTLSTGKGVVVAVLDTGVQASLPDLAGRVLPGRDFIRGGDATTDVPDPDVPYFGHGTGVSSFIAATGKGAGMLGVAPEAKILPAVVTLNGRSHKQGPEVQAIPWAVDHGASIINMSFAASSPCTPELQSAIDYALRKDVILVAAVGNSPDSSVGSPASCIGVIGIGALAQSATFQAWSGESRGPDVDFIAPGENLRSLLLSNQVSEPDGSGTSESAGIASGVFALMRSKFPDESARQIVTRVMYNLQNHVGTAEFGTRINNRIGYGSLQPSYALTIDPPANAVNPIYDEIDAHLKAASPTATPSPATAAKAATSSDRSDADRTVLVALISLGVAVVLVVVVVVVLLVVRSASRRQA